MGHLSGVGCSIEVINLTTFWGVCMIFVLENVIWGVHEPINKLVFNENCVLKLCLMLFL